MSWCRGAGQDEGAGLGAASEGLAAELWVESGRLNQAERRWNPE